MPFDFDGAIATHRSAMLRHCYRMLGSFAEAEDVLQDSLLRAWKSRGSYRGDAPIERWLFTIATKGCLNALASRRRVVLPQLESEAAGSDYVLGEVESSRFVTPAADSRLFPNPEASVESRETVALAFVALLQRLPPKQRAMLLLKDVLEWSAEETAEALGQSLPSVNSALHRARKTMALPQEMADEPTPAILRDFLRAWEAHDLDGLVALLREDIVLAMPPHLIWFRGRESVVGFFRSARFQAFWSAGIRLTPTHANGVPAFGFDRRRADGRLEPHSMMVARFLGGRAAEMTVFIGAHYFCGFDDFLRLDRSVSGRSLVLKGKGENP